MLFLTSKSVAILLMLIFSSFQVACFVFDGKDKWLKGELEYFEVKKNPQSERSDKFNSYPAEKQVDIYLFGMRYVAPADVVFREYLKVNGEAKILYLVEAIRNTDYPLERGYLVVAINEIDRECKCVANNSDVLKILKESEMPPNSNDDEGDKAWKDNYRMELFELERRSNSK